MNAVELKGYPVRIYSYAIAASCHLECHPERPLASLIAADTFASAHFPHGRFWPGPTRGSLCLLKLLTGNEYA